MEAAAAPPPEPIGLRALRVLLAREGQREDVGPNGKGLNQGDVVIWACRRWVRSESTWQELYEAGEMAWCAGALCSAFLEAGSEVIKQVASLRCDTMLSRIPPEWRVAAEQVQPGDVYYYGLPRPHHAGILIAPGLTISGNHHDDISRGQLRPDAPVTFARIPA